MLQRYLTEYKLKKSENILGYRYMNTTADGSFNRFPFLRSFVGGRRRQGRVQALFNRTEALIINNSTGIAALVELKE